MKSRTPLSAARRLVSLFTLLTTVTAAAGLSLTGTAQAADATTIKLGVSGGVMEDVADAVTRAAARDGLVVKTIVFSGPVNPNGPLNDGNIDANAFQHQPYLNGQIKTFGYKIVPVAKTLTAPLGFYSSRYKSLAQLPDGATVGIPNDDTNRNRALLILQHYGIIKLRSTLDVARGDNASLVDVVDNPKHLKIKEIDSLILARSLQDVDAGAIITAQASPAGLLVARDAIAVEQPGGVYANVLVVQEKNRNQPWVPILIKAFHSDDVRQVLATRFKGSLLPAF